MNHYEGNPRLNYERLLFIKSKIATLIMDLDNHQIIDSNEAAADLFRLNNYDELIGKTLVDLEGFNLAGNESLIDMFRAHIEQAIIHGHCEFAWKFQHSSGEVWDGEIHLLNFKHNNQNILQISIEDISEYKHTEQIFMLTNAELRASYEQLTATEEELRQQFDELEYVQKQLKIREEMYRNLVEDINCVIYEFDQNRALTYVSPAVKDIFGFEPYELQGVDFFELIHPDYIDYLFSIFRDISEGIEKISEDYRIITKSGEFKWVKSKNSLVKHMDKIVVRGVLFDIHKQKMNEEKIRYLSSYDVLTGAYNRSFFETKLKEYDESTESLPVSIIVADINGLKEVNDKFGQEEGDRLLKYAVNTLNHAIESKGFVARIGGDEFAILLENSDEEDIKRVLKRANNYCQTLEQEGINLSISMGTATKYALSDSIHKKLAIAEERLYNKKLLESKSTRSHLITSLNNIMSEKTFETKEHCERLVELSKQVAKKMNLKDYQIEKLRLLSLMHDIGKIAIPENILGKPGRLTDAEWLEMKKHTEIGYRIANKTPELAGIAFEILSHHERWDGKGYPQGLKGTEIPLESRILAVVDAFDAMTSDRVYRKALPLEDAIKELTDNMGTQFDPAIVEIFLKEIVNE